VGVDTTKSSSHAAKRQKRSQPEVRPGWGRTGAMRHARRWRGGPGSSIFSASSDPPDLTRCDRPFRVTRERAYVANCRSSRPRRRVALAARATARLALASVLPIPPLGPARITSEASAVAPRLPRRSGRRQLLEREPSCSDTAPSACADRERDQILRPCVDAGGRGRSVDPKQRTTTGGRCLRTASG